MSNLMRMGAGRCKGSSSSASDPLTYFGANLWGWWDANSLSTLYQDSGATTPVTADEDVVGYWGDKSGNARHGTAAGAVRPVYDTGIQNGLPGIRFDPASSQTLSLANAATLHDVTIAAAFSVSNDANNKTIISGSSAGAAGMFLNATEDARLISQTTATVLSGGGVLGVAYVVACYDEGTAYTDAANLLYNNGSSVKAGGTAGGVSFTANVNRIGSGGGASFWYGWLFELIVINKVIDSTELAWLNSYLSTRWGM